MTCEHCKNGLTGGGQVCTYCNGTGKVQTPPNVVTYKEGDKVSLQPGTNLLTQNGSFLVQDDQTLKEV